MPVVFLRDIHKGHLKLEDADDEQSNFAAKLTNLSKGNKTIEKYFSWDYYLLQEKKFLITLKANYFQ